MNNHAIQEMSAMEIDSVGGGLSGVEGGGIILALGAFALGSPIVVGLALGAGLGLIAAQVMAN